MRDRIGAGRQRGTGMRLNDDGIRIYEPISAVQDIAGAVHWRPPYGGHEAGDDAMKWKIAAAAPGRCTVGNDAWRYAELAGCRDCTKKVEGEPG